MSVTHVPSEVMEGSNQEPTQQTKPAKGKTVTIPVPERAYLMAFLEKTAKMPHPDRQPPAE
jgi:hypothetical protein